VPTFQKTETVDARQFKGGKQNGTDLALWVNSNGQLTETRAKWVSENPNFPEFIALRTNTYTYKKNVFVGDWIILKQDGEFDAMRPQEFEAEYKQV